WAHAILVFDGDPIARGDSANAAQFELWKLLVPRIKQRHCVMTGNCEEQFEILSISEGGREWLLLRSGSFRHLARGPADWDGRGEQFASDAAGSKNMPQVAAQAITQIDHRMHGEMLRQPSALLQARLKLQMF